MLTIDKSSDNATARSTARSTKSTDSRSKRSKGKDDDRSVSTETGVGKAIGTTQAMTVVTERKGAGE